MDDTIYQEYPNNYCCSNYNNMYDYNNQYDYYSDNYRQANINSSSMNQSNRDLEGFYPDIYKIVYPVVKKACQSITEPPTKETIDKMVDNIYINIEGNDMVQLNINKKNVTNETTTNKTYKDVEKTDSIKDYRNVYNNTYESLKKEINEKLDRKNDFKYISETKRNTNKDTNYMPEPKREVRGGIEDKRDNRQFNRGLSDLIRILLIRELTGRPIFPGNRPPYGPPPPPPPGRPPYGPPPPPPFRFV